MKYPISKIHAVMVAGAIAALPLFPLNAAAQIAVSSNDGKVILVNGVVGVPANPIDDTVTIINLGVSPPKIIAEFKAPSSVAGPPQNVAVAPDESFALVASSMKLDPADPKKQVPDNRLSVIDLKAKPPANGTKLTKVAEVNIGKWPQGVAWSRDGKTLLAQSMVDNALAVVSFNGKSLKVTGQVKVTGGPDGIRTAGH
jgi:hypothetical protein